MQLSIQPCIKTTFEAWLELFCFQKRLKVFQLKTRSLGPVAKKTLMKSPPLRLSLSANQCVCLHGTTANNKARNYQKLLPSQISDRARQKNFFWIYAKMFWLEKSKRFCKHFSKNKSLWVAKDIPTFHKDKQLAMNYFLKVKFNSTYARTWFWCKLWLFSWNSVAWITLKIICYTLWRTTIYVTWWKFSQFKGQELSIKCFSRYKQNDQCRFSVTFQSDSPGHGLGWTSSRILRWLRGVLVDMTFRLIKVGVFLTAMWLVIIWFHGRLRRWNF